MSNEATRDISIVAVRNAIPLSRQDSVVLEEPLEIRLSSVASPKTPPISVAITMRTPGHDEELALGFLWSERLLTDIEQIESIRLKGPIQSGGFRNIVEIGLSGDTLPDLSSASRNFYMTSSCGICGKASLEAVEQERPFSLERAFPQFASRVICRMPETLRRAQETFDRTGGLHAAALFDAQGEMILLREDIGRHNAVDKVVGAALHAMSLPLSHSLLFVSGRASFELVQKAIMAGIPALAAVGAPSSLAVSLAREAGLTLLGFVREERFNIYSGEERIAFSEEQ